jgi:hypothetical protein
MDRYSHVFERFKEGRFEEVEALLQPLIEAWAQDVLWPTPQRGNRDWRQTLVHDVSVRLRFALERLLTNGGVASGYHLVNWLRLVGKREMERSYQRLFPVPTPRLETRKARSKTSDSTVKDWELRHQVKLQERSGPHSQEVGQLRPTSDPRFFAKDEERAERYWRYIGLVTEAAQAAAGDKRDAAVVTGILSGQRSVSRAAKTSNIAGRTAQERLRKMGPAIIESASPVLRDLGSEFQPSVWEVPDDSEIAPTPRSKSQPLLSRPPSTSGPRMTRSGEFWTNSDRRPRISPQRGIGVREGEDERSNPSRGATRPDSTAKPRQTSLASSDVRD